LGGHGGGTLGQNPKKLGGGGGGGRCGGSGRKKGGGGDFLKTHKKGWRGDVGERNWGKRKVTKRS